jgi:hypothetical protein
MQLFRAPKVDRSRLALAMRAADVIPGLAHPSPCLICRNALDWDGPRYRVPVGNSPLESFEQRPDAAAGQAALDALPELVSTVQLRAVVTAGAGMGLWIPRRLLEMTDQWRIRDRDKELRAGSILIYPPAEWARLRFEMGQWQFTGIEDAFDGLEYTFDDILPFAGPSCSPDLWYLVLRGPMAGNVCWWSHDGGSEMKTPWAEDVRAWAEGIFQPEFVATVAEIGPFSAKDSIDPAPADAQLNPIEYLPETPTGEWN